MKFPIRQNSKSKINNAGCEFAEGRVTSEALSIINNWKSCHSYPLQVVKMTLQNRAKRIETSPLIAQRMKRLSSIGIKLKRNPNMELSTMQDLGGCRAVMKNIANVDALIELYKEARLKTPSNSDIPRTRPVWTDEKDYISHPKSDGYRSYHLICRYYSNAKHKKIFNGQRIEIQIRSRLQHLWATAVEVVEAFSKHPLKSKISPADQSWTRFFVLMGSAFALREKRPIVPDTPSTKRELVHELQIINDDQRILDCLSGWGASKEMFGETIKGADSFLLRLNTKERRLWIRAFPKGEYDIALEQCDIEERRNSGDPTILIVLVRVDDVNALEKAYPNYYVDTSAFVKEVKQLFLSSSA